VALARVWLGAEVRRHWRRQLALALCMGIAAAVVLSVVAGSRRTASAYERYERAHGVTTVEINPSGSIRLDELRALGRGRDVEAAGSYIPLFAAPRIRGVIPGADFVVFAANDDQYGRAIDRPLLAAGRLPDPSRADEVLAGVNTARKLGLRVGSVVKLASFPSRQTKAFFDGDFDALTLTGPAPTVTVVGVGRTRLDLDSAGYASKYFFATQAFANAYREKIIAYSSGVLDVRLRSGTKGVDAFLKTIPRNVARNEQFSAYAIARSPMIETTRTQAIALGLVGLAAALAFVLFGVVVVGRIAASIDDDRAILNALGLRRRQRAAAAIVRLLPATIGAVVVAATGMWLASAIFPTGPAGTIETTTGRVADTTVLLLGVSIVVLVVVLSAGARPLATRSTARRGIRAARTGRAIGLAPPAIATGLRWAAPGVGALRNTARGALVGVVVAVTAVVAGATYIGSLEHLVVTPGAYGSAYDVDGGGGESPQAVVTLRDKVLRDPAVGDVAVAHIAPIAAIGEIEMQAYAVTPIRGPLGFSVTKGRTPQAPDEVLLGPSSADALDVGVGDSVVGRDRSGADVPLRVVGIGPFPTIETDAYRTGALVLPQTLERVGKGDRYDEVVFDFAPGADLDAGTARLREARIMSGTGIATPGPVGDLRNIRNYPRWLVGFVALLGIAVALNVLVITPTRRRRELGELRALGFTARQLRRASAVQGATLAAVGSALGVPLGIVVGRLIWAAHAHSLGVVVSTQTRWSWIATVAFGALVALTLVAIAASHASRHAQPAENLRAE
jgi:hypothetical protein